MKYKSSRYCPNCHFPLPYKAKFCARCGQKSSDGRISIRALIKLIWFRVLHLESRSLRFMWLLFVPGYATQEFFSGRQKRYPQPIRFFFIVMFFFLFTVNHLSNSSGLKTNTTLGGVTISEKKGGKKQKTDFYKLGRRYSEYVQLQQEIDSLPPEYRSPVARKAIDSLLQRTYGADLVYYKEIIGAANGSDSTKVVDLDSLELHLGLKTIKLATLDVFRYDAETIAEKYEITHWVEKVLLSQGIKTMQDPTALLQAYLGSLVWTMLALLGVMAGVLTLFYWRQGRYYVEHFIFLLHQHSAQFLLLGIALWVNELFALGKFWFVLIFWIILSTFLAMRRFYGQSIGMQLLKFFAFLVFYIIGFGILFFVGMMVVFLLF